MAPDVPTWVNEWVCAGVCVALAGLLRLVVDLLVPTTAPFVFLFPAVLLATLAAGWRSGVALPLFFGPPTGRPASARAAWACAAAGSCTAASR